MIGQKELISALLGCLVLFSQATPRTLQSTDSKYADMYCHQGKDWGFSKKPKKELDVSQATCRFGLEQSPVDLPKDGSAPSLFVLESLKSSLEYCKVNTITYQNPGKSPEFSWDSNDACSSFGSIPDFNRAQFFHLNFQRLLQEDSSVDDCPTLEQKAKLYEHGPDAFSTTDFKPVQMHFHTPSEHTFGGKHCQMEQHIVGYPDGDEERVSVFAVLYNCPWHKGNGYTEHEGLATLLEGLDNAGIGTDLAEEQLIDSIEELDLEDFLPESRSYYTYRGSLTTPPCSEGLLWHVFKEPLSASPMQIKRFHGSFAEHTECNPRGNFRHTQDLNGRQIFYYDEDMEYCSKK